MTLRRALLFRADSVADLDTCDRSAVVFIAQSGNVQRYAFDKDSQQWKTENGGAGSQTSLTTVQQFLEVETSDEPLMVVGPQGPAGIGIQGPQGIPGLDGRDADEPMMISGPQGIQGNAGAQGVQGIQGNPGATGSQGIQGQPAPALHFLVDDSRDEPFMVPPADRDNSSAMVTTPAVPASTVAIKNSTGRPVVVYIKGGTLTVISVGGISTGISAAAPAGVAHSIPLAINQTVAITYSLAPTWVWIGAQL